MLRIVNVVFTLLIFLFVYTARVNRAQETASQVYCKNNDTFADKLACFAQFASSNINESVPETLDLDRVDDMAYFALVENSNDNSVGELRLNGVVGGPPKFSFDDEGFDKMVYRFPPDGGVPHQSCWSGYLAVPIDTIFTCDGAKVDAAEFKKKPEAERKKCTYPINTVRVCICPISTVWVMRNLNNEWLCTPRLLLAAPRLDDKYMCRDDFNNNLGLHRDSPSDFCIHVKRDETLDLQLNVSYRWTENNELQTLLYVNDSLVVFGYYEQSKQYLTLSKAVSGTYSELERSNELFQFVVEPNPLNPYGFGMVAGHPIQRDGYFEHVVYPFKDISLLLEEQRIQPLADESAMKVYFGSDKNFTLHRIRRSLFLLSDEFIVGDVMYMELGFYSIGFPYNTRCARIWLTFENLPFVEEKYSYDNSISPFIFALIIFFVLIFIGIVVAVVWFICKRTPDIDDRLVIDAQKASSKPKIE